MTNKESYNVFLDYYDKIVRSTNNPLEDEVDFLVEDCIKEYKPETKTILELACGTGEVARELVKKWYKVTGLDINKKMLEKAQKNLIPPSNSPFKGGEQVKLVLWDMTNFDLAKTFDTILCNYNSICHLLKWEDWQNFFEMCNKHLEKDWLLVFDINTIFEFENITRDFAQFYNFWNDTVCLEMFKKDGIYEWLVKIFKQSPLSISPQGREVKQSNYELIEEVVRENSFPINKIKKELSVKWFEILEMIDYHYGEVTAKSERVYFICKKK